MLWFVGTAFVMVLMLGYRTSTAGPGTAPGPRGAQPPGVIAAPAPTASSAPATAGPTAPGSATLVNGQVMDTRWGPVQVQVRILGHRITDVSAIVYPNGNDRDASINAYALLKATCSPVEKIGSMKPALSPTITQFLP